MSKTNGNHPAQEPEEEQEAPVKFRKRKPLDNLVGTKEAARILGVERTRIGKWRKRGIMPPVMKELDATPVWDRRDIEQMIPWVESNRRSTADEKEMAAA